MDVSSFLESKGVELKQTNGGEGHTHCFFCNEDESKPGRLYVHTAPDDNHGTYFCHLCQSKGGFNSLIAHFGDDPAQYGATASATSLQIFNDATDYYKTCLRENVEVYDYLLYERGLTEEKINAMQLGWADNGLLTHLISEGYDMDAIKAAGLIKHSGSEFLEDQITIPYFNYGNTTAIRGKKIGGKYLSLPGSKAQLFGSDEIRGERDVIITAGEFDAAVLQQMGYAACGVPGENIWNDEWMDFFSEAGRVFILFDNDTAGQNGAEKLALKFGPRARVVSFPASKKKLDVTEFVVGQSKTKDDIDMLLIKAKGGLLTTVHDAYEQWLEIEGNTQLAGSWFNIDELDHHLQHGILPGQVVTTIARSNAGKTIVTINTMYRMLLRDPDLRFLYVSLEQTRNEWFERAHRIHNFYNPGATVLDTQAFWAKNLLMIDKNRLSIDDLEACIDQYAFETGDLPNFVVIDYLGYFARSYRGEEYTRITDCIMDTKALAKDRGVSILMPHQANRSGDFGKEVSADMGRGSGAVEETSDLLMALWAPDQQIGTEESDQQRQLHLKILKSRDGGVNSKVILQFAPLSLAVVPKSDPLYGQAVREVQYAMAGDTWKTAIYRHLSGDQRLDIDQNGVLERALQAKATEADQL